MVVVVVEAVRNNGTRNGCLAAIMHCCRREECSLAHSPTQLTPVAAGRQRGVPRRAACSCSLRALQAACCANPLSLAHIQLGHAVNWPQLQVRRYLHTPIDALTLLGPNASPSCYSTHFYS